MAKESVNEAGKKAAAEWADALRKTNTKQQEAAAADGKAEPEAPTKKAAKSAKAWPRAMGLLVIFGIAVVGAVVRAAFTQPSTPGSGPLVTMFSDLAVLHRCKQCPLNGLDTAVEQKGPTDLVSLTYLLAPMPAPPILYAPHTSNTRFACPPLSPLTTSPCEVSHAFRALCR